MSFGSAGPGWPGTTGPTTTSAAWPALPPAARESLDALLAGNARFRAGRPVQPRESFARTADLLAGQHPRAAYLGCVDSRVPADAVLDQGLGEMFTVRTAGHVVDHAVLASLEYGIAELEIPLVLVAGHERCGAVAAAIAALEQGAHVPGAVGVLVEAIRPAVQDTIGIADPAARLESAVRSHTRTTARELLLRSNVIRAAVDRGQLGVVAGWYSLSTGELTPA